MRACRELIVKEKQQQFLRKGKKKSQYTIRTKQELRFRLFFPGVLMCLAFISIGRFRQSCPLTHNSSQGSRRSSGTLDSKVTVQQRKASSSEKGFKFRKPFLGIWFRLDLPKLIY